MVSGNMWPIIQQVDGDGWIDCFRDAGAGSAPDWWSSSWIRKLTQPLHQPMVFHNDLRDKEYPTLIAKGMERDVSILYSNSGAESVEAAIKLARRASGRKLILGHKRDFHGRTLATLALYGDGPAYYHNGFGPYPDGIGWLDHFDDNPLGFAYNTGHGLTQQTHYDRLNSVAAVVISPLLGQNTLEAQPQWMWNFCRKARDAGALIIFDEVQTGFGRAGGLITIGTSKHIMATEVPMEPDIWCFGKAAGGGWPLSLTVCSPVLANWMGVGTTFNTMAGSPLGIALSQEYVRALKGGWLETALEHGLMMSEAIGSALIRKGYMFAVAATDQYAFIDEMRKRHVFVTGHLDKPTRITLPFGLSNSQIVGISSRIKECLEAANAHSD